MRYADVLDADVFDGKLCVLFNFPVSFASRGYFEIGGFKFCAKDGDWIVDRKRLTSSVVWDVPKDFQIKSNEHWKIQGLYDHNQVRILSEGRFCSK